MYESIKKLTVSVYSINDKKYSFHLAIYCFFVRTFIDFKKIEQNMNHNVSLSCSYSKIVIY